MEKVTSRENKIDNPCLIVGEDDEKFFRSEYSGTTRITFYILFGSLQIIQNCCLYWRISSVYIYKDSDHKTTPLNPLLRRSKRYRALQEEATGLSPLFFLLLPHSVRLSEVSPRSLHNKESQSSDLLHLLRHIPGTLFRLTCLCATSNSRHIQPRSKPSLIHCLNSELCWTLIGL